MKEKKKRKIPEEKCCICRKPSDICIPHPNDSQLRIGLCDKHWGEYCDKFLSDMEGYKGQKAWLEKQFNKEIKPIPPPPPPIYKGEGNDVKEIPTCQDDN